jgi:hypothetical protein
MKVLAAILVAGMALSLTGCSLRGKQQQAKAIPPTPRPVAEPAPAPPPAPPPKLSIPQTNVELPPPQPVNMDALNQAQQQEEAAPPAASTPRRAPRQAPRSTAATPAAGEPAATPPATTPPATQPVEPDRPPVITEIVPAGDAKRFQEEAAARKREIVSRLEQANGRGLRGREKQLADRINGFLKSCEAAEARGDWRQASELSERGLALARELTGGK